MSEEKADRAPAGASRASDSEDAGAAQPRFRIAAQYVKDVSFENPKGPAAPARAQARPEIEMHVDVRAGEPSPRGQQEMVLELTVEVKAGDETLFLVELAYAALAVVENASDEARELFLFVECPKLLFPFARRVIADLTREGGFPPLLIEPIDFLALYRNRLERRRNQRQAQAGQAAG